MKNFFTTLAAAVMLWIGWLYLGPDLLRLEWVNRLRASLPPLPTPAPVLPALPPANPASPVSGRSQPPPVVSGQPSLPAAKPNPTPEPVAKPEVLNAVVTVTGNLGAGTGFFCNFRGHVYVATNQHVLGVGSPLTIRTSTGAPVAVRQIVAATDADIALLDPVALPPGVSPLTVATLPDPAVRKDDATLVPGNSKGDGVITQTNGKLLAIGPQRVEVDNPVYPGNSGSPILDVPTGRVIGMLTEAELVTLNEFEKASFRSKDSAIKTTVRYFGHRLDSVQRWEPLNWATYQETETFLRQSRSELNGIVGYLTDSSTAYKSLRELHDSVNQAEQTYASSTESLADKMEAYDRLFQDLERFSRRAKSRFDGRKIYYQQQEKVDTIHRLANAIIAASNIARRDRTLAATILSRQHQ